MNEKTKFGLSISLMAAILFALGLVSYWCLFAAAIFILITEKDEWLRKMAGIGIFSTIILILVHTGFDILGYLIILSSRMIGRYHTLPNEIEVIVDMGESIFYIVMIILCFVHNYSNVTAMNGTNMEHRTQGNPMQNTSVPPKTQGNPMQNTSVPPTMQGNSMQNTSVPPTMQGNPMQSTSIPLRTQGNPMQSTSILPRTQGNPMQSTSIPPTIQKNPVQNASIPSMEQKNEMQNASIHLTKQQPTFTEESNQTQEQSVELIEKQVQIKKCPVCDAILKEDATLCENCGSQI